MEEYCQRRWGGSGWIRQLKSEGAKVGAPFGDWKTWPNTLKAHQLLRYCEDQLNLSTDMVNNMLFKAEYEEGKNISDVDTLVELASQLGVEDLALASLREYMTMDQGASTVHAEIRSGRSQFGIRGVPFFVVQGQDPTQRPYAFSGAQEAHTLVALFRDVTGDDSDA